MSGDKQAVTRHAAPASIRSLALYSVKGLPYGCVEVCCARCGMLALFGSAGDDDLALSDLAVWGRYHMCLASEPGADDDVVAAQAERPWPTGKGSQPTTSL